MSWIKKLLASKISINITIVQTSDPGILSTTVPREVPAKVLKINTVRKSDFRFVSKVQKYHDRDRISYYTERFKDGKWKEDHYSNSHIKEEAMQLHLLLLEKGTLAPTNSKTILWEGLSKEETKMWVALQADPR
jgi:hypothetical protein